MLVALREAIEVDLSTRLVRTMEDILQVLRQASQPLRPIGAEWLTRQERALTRDDSSKTMAVSACRSWSWT